VAVGINGAEFGIGVQAQKADEFHFQARFLPHLADGGLGGRFARGHAARGQAPEIAVGAFLQQDAALVIGDDDRAAKADAGVFCGVRAGFEGQIGHDRQKAGEMPLLYTTDGHFIR